MLLPSPSWPIHCPSNVPVMEVTGVHNANAKIEKDEFASKFVRVYSPAIQPLPAHGMGDTSTAASRSWSVKSSTRTSKAHLHFSHHSKDSRLAISLSKPLKEKNHKTGHSLSLFAQGKPEDSWSCWRYVPALGCNNSSQAPPRLHFTAHTGPESVQRTAC